MNNNQQDALIVKSDLMRAINKFFAIHIGKKRIKIILEDNDYISTYYRDVRSYDWSSMEENWKLLSTQSIYSDHQKKLLIDIIHPNDYIRRLVWFIIEEIISVRQDYNELRNK